ncbi:MAG: HEPN domain-containing protein [bacterium]|nr:HEPN domain-containing protein [bacterium]
MTDGTPKKEELVEHRLEKAFKTIEEVRFLLENEMLTLAVNRIYYGMFYAVSALALQHGFTTSKHKAISRK